MLVFYRSCRLAFSSAGCCFWALGICSAAFLALGCGLCYGISLHVGAVLIVSFEFVTCPFRRLHPLSFHLARLGASGPWVCSCHPGEKSGCFVSLGELASIMVLTLRRRGCAGFGRCLASFMLWVVPRSDCLHLPCMLGAIYFFLLGPRETAPCLHFLAALTPLKGPSSFFLVSGFCRPLYLVVFTSASLFAALVRSLYSRHIPGRSRLDLY